MPQHLQDCVEELLYFASKMIYT